MISVDEAKAIIRSNVSTLPPTSLSIAEAGGYVLAEDVYATIDIPAFNQSSMDGYAFRFNDFAAGSPLLIDGEIPAGTPVENTLQSKQAIRIFTGAAVPAGADTVVMQEKVTIDNNGLLILD